MTLETCQRLLDHFEKVMNDNSRNAAERAKAKLDYDNMKSHMDSKAKRAKTPGFSKKGGA